MGFKEFIKPTIWKIVLGFVFFAILTTNYYLNHKDFVCPVFNGKPALCTPEPFFSYLIPLLIYIIGGYLLSCIIFKIIKTNRNK